MAQSARVVVMLAVSLIADAAGAASEAENAVYSLKHNFGIDASRHVPRNVRSLDLPAYDLIIPLDRRAAAVQERAIPGTRRYGFSCDSAACG